jgi:opacity protein-like surface antigen
MKKILTAALVAAAAAILAAPAHADPQTVVAPGGTLTFSTSGAGNHFAYSAPVPQDWNPGSTWDEVTADWQTNVHVHDLACVDVSLDQPGAAADQSGRIPQLDYGWHCTFSDYPITSDLISDVSLNDLTDDLDMSSPGMTSFPAFGSAWWGGTDSVPVFSSFPNLDPYVGQTLVGHVRVQSESWAYYGSWPSTNTVTALGRSGTTSDFQAGAMRHLAADGPHLPSWGKGVKIRVKIPHTAADCHVPALRGKTLRRAALALRRANCRLGHVTRVKARPTLRGKVVRVAHARRWLPRHHRVRLVVGR